jgi:Rha family phage regulatory protein
VLGAITSLMQKLSANSRNPALYFKDRNYLGHDGKPHPCFDLTRLGFDLLVLGFNGKKAFEFKLIYIERFNAMSECLLVMQANSLNLEWKEQRSTGKETHSLYTDTCEQFLAYAKVQRGNDDYRKYFYANLGKAKLKALFTFDVDIKPCRDLLSKQQIKTIEQADVIADKALLGGIDLGLEYKDVYQKAVMAVQDFGLLVGNKLVPDEQA